MPLAKVLSNHEGDSEEESGAVREVLRVHAGSSQNSIEAILLHGGLF